MAEKARPLGGITPHVWVIEATHGCNLRCGHCSCRLQPPGEYEFMSEDAWKSAWKVMQEVSPNCRVDICLGGEPTLHPDLPRLIADGRATCPSVQIQVTTNGTILLKGTRTYRELFDAGANVVYTDMYGPRDEFRRLAEESGAPWYFYYSKPKDAPSPWTYHGPDLKIVVLQEQPENWPKSRFRAGLLGTWYNNLDWEAAKRFGLRPVEKPPARRCNQPFCYVPVHVSGQYLLCCQDNMGETAGTFGRVQEGVDGFKRYWFGREIQLIRRRLREKNREDTSQCSRCCITFSRCDYKRWTDEEVNRWWDGERWQPLEEEPGFDRFAKPAKKTGFNLEGDR
jgi:hypothetical protein